MQVKWLRLHTLSVQKLIATDIHYLNVLEIMSKIVDKEMWDHYSELPNPAWYDYKNKQKEMKENKQQLYKDISELTKSLTRLAKILEKLAKQQL